MQTFLSLSIIVSLIGPISGFVPVTFVSRKDNLIVAAIADSQTTPLQNDVNDTWVVHDFNKGPSDWLPENSVAPSKFKAFDWFTTASQSFAPDDSLTGRQVSGRQPPQGMPDCDWFAGASPFFTSVSTVSPQSVNAGPSDWFAQALTTSQDLRRQGNAADWFDDAVKSGSPVQPEQAPSIRAGPSGWFGQFTSLKVPDNLMTVPHLQSGSSEWFSQDIKAGAELPEPSNQSTAGPHEWFGQEIAPDTSESARITQGLCQGPSEWFTDARPSETSTVKMTPHEWFSVQDATVYAPDTRDLGTSISSESRHEWFMYALDNQK